MVPLADFTGSARLELIRWVSQIGAVTAEALAVHTDASVASARGRLHAALRDGQLARSRPLAGQPALFSATRAGMHAAAVHGLAPVHITPANARHATVCALAAAKLERAFPLQDVIGERGLRCEEQRAGAPLASAMLGRALDGGALLHRPDLVLWPRSGGAPTAVEIELTVKAPRRLLAICRAWARCACVEGVIYIAGPGVGRALERAVSGAQGGERIVVVGFGSLGL